MKRFVPLFLFTTLLLVACAPVVSPLTAATLPSATRNPNAPALSTELPQPKTVTVFADDSLSNAFAQMAADVQADHPGLRVDIRFGDAQSLRKLVEQGAQADVFASADLAEMDILSAGKYVDLQTVKVFSVNQLVVILPALNPSNLSTLQDLAKPGIKLVLAAKELTLGKYSQQALDNLDKAFGAGYKDNVLKNVVSYEQDASQVLSKIKFGKADAGIVYVSDLAASPQLQSIQIPSDGNVVFQYSIMLLSGTPNPDLARIFMEYVFTPNGEAILQKWGFLQDR